MSVFVIIIIGARVGVPIIIIVIIIITIIVIIIIIIIINIIVGSIKLLSLILHHCFVLFYSFFYFIKFKFTLNFCDYLVGNFILLYFTRN